MPGASILFALLCVGAGVSVALQQVMNTNLRVQIGSPWWAGFTSYLVGLLAMLLAASLAGRPAIGLEAALRLPWFSWFGGLFGAIFIATGILMVPRLGSATVLALIVVGQMLAALAFDHFGLLGVPQHAASPVRLAGAALLILGVVLIRR